MMVPFYLATKNVSRKKERSVLTIIGVLLAVGAFVALLSLAEGLYVRIQREMNGRNVDLYVAPRSALPMPVGPIAGVGMSTETIPESVVTALKTWKNVAAAEAVYRFQQTFDGRGLVIWAMAPDAFAAFIRGLSVDSSHYPKNDKEVLIGDAIAREFNLSEGGFLTIAGDEFRIVGTFTTGGGLTDYFCYVSVPAAQRIIGNGAQEVWCKLKETNDANDTADDINKSALFAQVKARTAAQYLGAASEFINYAWLLQFAVAAIGVLIAMSAAMNTMLMSTYERLKEFATLRAIGASRINVMVMILLESVILSLAGGVLGVVVGAMGARLLDSAVMTLFKTTFPIGALTAPLILEGLILSVAVGLVGAVIPCAIIFRMNIIAGLRHD